MTPSDYIDYFKMIAEQHVDLAHDDVNNRCFYDGNIDAFLDGLIDFAGDGPFMFLEHKSGKLGDAGDNPFDHTRAAFMILKKVEPNDAADEKTKLNECWAIGNDILKRMYKEVREEGNDQPFDTFHLNTVAYQKIGATIDREKGYRFEFDLPEGMDFTYDETKWISES